MIIDVRCKDDNTLNIVSISGGKDSLAQWLVAVENEVPALPVFADTGHEHTQTMDYLDYLESKLGKVTRVKADFTRRIEGKRNFIAEKWPVSLVEDCGMSPDQAAERIALALDILKPTGIPFLDLCMWKGRFPSTKARFCTFDLKHEPVRTQVVLPALDEYDEVISWQGVRAQESPARAGLPVWEEDADNTPGLHVYRPILNCCMKMCLLWLNAMVSNQTHSMNRAVVVLDVCLAFMLANLNWRKYSADGQKR